MKELFLIRHAKSSWEFPDLDDIQRPILPKGYKRTVRVGKYLRKGGHNPDVILSSPAVRAIETAKIIAGMIEYPIKKIWISDPVYFEGSQNILKTIKQLSDEYEKVFLVGHNPTITTLANNFLKDHIDYIPTSGVLCLSFDVDQWKEISIKNGKRKFYITPKILKY